MYRKEKNHILKLLDSVRETIDLMKCNEPRPEWIADCIEAVKAVRHFFEQDMVVFDHSQMDKLMTALYDINSHIQDRTAFLGFLKCCKKELQCLRRDITMLPARHIAVFLPYKVSMWTAMESIWQAADADPACDVFVVPIPYETLKIAANGSLVSTGTVYEGTQYPPEVPITFYRDLSLDQLQPDMIFIHNPYDNNNTLTRVPEEYYSCNLKDKTSLLVYSPYFSFRVYQGKGTGLYHACANLKADIILSQSKRVTEIYKENGVDSTKLLTLGSPKMDAVVQLIKNPPDVPNAWKEKVTGRKVFLLNMHFGFFFGSAESVDNAFLYMHWIMDAIASHPDCALIFRPHPLAEDMFASRGLLPTLQRFRKIKREIADGPYSILDETPSYGPAFCLSSAMFTTESSLINEYLVTGKPVYQMDNNLFGMQTSSCLPLYKMFPVDPFVSYFSDELQGKKFLSSTAEIRPGVDRFIEMICNGEDPKREMRLAEVRKAFLNADGTCGQKVYCALVDELSKRSV